MSDFNDDYFKELFIILIKGKKSLGDLLDIFLVHANYKIHFLLCKIVR